MLIRKFVVIVAFVVSSLAVTTSSGAAERVWDTGTVWGVSYIRTKPGKFNDYLDDLSRVWKRSLEEQMKTGDVISYKILNVTSPRHKEADLVLLVEFKNYGTFDRSMDYFENMMQRVIGSQDDVARAAIDRGELRTLMGGFTAQELHFMK